MLVRRRGVGWIAERGIVDCCEAWEEVGDWGEEEVEGAVLEETGIFFEAAVEGLRS